MYALLTEWVLTYDITLFLNPSENDTGFSFGNQPIEIDVLYIYKSSLQLNLIII
jgi:hypothetical protein